MGNLRLDFEIWKLTIAIAIFVFPIALLIYLFSGCDLRRRGDKHECRDGSAASCLSVGQFYEERSDGLVATMLSNATTAKQYYDRACKLGSSAGCARLGHMVAVGSYNTMRDGDLTRDDGIAALTKACDLGDTDACRELAGVAEPAQAKLVLGKLCDQHDKASCDALVSADVTSGDPKRATETLARLCDAGDAEHCRELGATLLAGSNSDEASLARGTELLQQACDRSEWSACRELAEAKLAADPTKAAELLAKACDHADLDACFEQGRALVATDPAKAVQIFTAECAHDDRGCDALGDVYRVGVEGIERDRDQARTFYQTACHAGSEFDCHKIKCLDASSDDCYRVHKDQRKRLFRLGGKFDM